MCLKLRVSIGSTEAPHFGPSSIFFFFFFWITLICLVQAEIGVTCVEQFGQPNYLLQSWQLQDNSQSKASEHTTSQINHIWGNHHLVSSNCSGGFFPHCESSQLDL